MWHSFAPYISKSAWEGMNSLPAMHILKTFSLTFWCVVCICVCVLVPCLSVMCGNTSPLWTFPWQFCTSVRQTMGNSFLLLLLYENILYSQLLWYRVFSAQSVVLQLFKNSLFWNLKVKFVTKVCHWSLAVVSSV